MIKSLPLTRALFFIEISKVSKSLKSTLYNL